MRRVGRWGEAAVYSKLIENYEQQACKITGTDTGFKCRNRKGINVDVIWHNKGRPIDEDSGHHIDLEIIKTDDQGKLLKHNYKAKGINL